MPIKVESGARGRIDWPFLFAAGGLVVMGTLAIFSAASPVPSYASIVRTHLMALVMGTTLFLFGLGFNYQIFEDQAKVVYLGVLLSLLAVLLVGSVHKGHKAWLHLGFFTFQPAELARIAIVLILAAFLDYRSRRIRDFSTILLAMGIVAPILMLILKQPDFSTALTFMPIMFGMFFCAGADALHLLVAMGYAATTISMPLMYTYLQFHYPNATHGLAHFLLQTSRLGGATAALLIGATLACLAAWRLSVMLRMHAKTVYFVALPVVLAAGVVTGILVNKTMKSYQRNRFVAYVAPESDIQGAAYHVRQSQIAIGSGGPWGKGLFNGTQSQLGFLPERHTDFIYAVVGEELGFVGAVTILALYLILIWRIVCVGRASRDRYGFLVCAGFATMFAFELVLNVGMCLGLMPVAGIPLPLISYGGSSLVITMWSLGIIANIYSRRYALL